MKNIRDIRLNEINREELLPGFEEDFPYIATCAELDKYVLPVVPWHWHKTIELFYMKSGCLEYTTPHGKWTIPAGSGGFVNANILHSSQIKSTGSENIQLLHLFDPVFLAGTQESRIMAKYILPMITSSDLEMIPLYADVAEHRPILDEICAAFEIGQDWGYEFKLREMLTSIWMKLFRLAEVSEKGSANRGNDGLIKSIMIYIHENYSREISAEQLAESAHVSVRTLFRIFKEQLHMTPVEYITGFRLQKACELLVSSGESVTAVAYACGFGSASYFGRIFRGTFGCTPAQYRTQWHDRNISGRK